MKTYNVAINVTFESKKPIQKPYWMSVDGMTVKLKDGTVVAFDTVQFSGDQEVLDDGRIRFEFEKSDFDIEHFKDNVDYFSTRSKEDPPDWSEILTGEFIELYIVGDSTEEECEDIGNADMVITEVVFSLYGDAGESKEVELTKEQIETLNRNIESTYAVG